VERADVLSGDAGLAGVRWMLLGPNPRRVLRRELAAMLGDPHVLASCRLRRAKFKPRRKLTAYYEAYLRDSDDMGRGSRPVAVTWTPGEGERRSEWTVPGGEAEALARGLATPFRTLEATVPGRGMRILVSPLDVRFRHLARLSDPGFVAEAVSHGRDARCRVTPIRYRPGQRHVLRYDLDRRDGSRETVFAKLYEDERGERTFEVATSVADWLATSGVDSAAVRPLAYLADSRAVLYPALAGGPLSKRLARRDADGAERLRQAGALLRTLQRAPLTLADRRDPYQLASEVSAVARASEHVKVLLPGAASRIAAILERAQELHDRLPRERPAFAHGDFKLDHLWLAPDGLTLIDPDRSCVADPAFDIGKFLADLHWWHLMAGRAGLPQAQRDFLDGCGAVASSPRVLRARVYEAVLLVKIAARRVALFDRRWRPLAEALISRAERTLAELERERHPRRTSRSQRLVAGDGLSGQIGARRPRKGAPVDVEERQPNGVFGEAGKSPRQ
jgi:aminoglycoside phosphotransferase (APT) family kinase protein